VRNGARWWLLATLLALVRPACADIRIELDGVDGDIRATCSRC
jgi:hypothetical protein